MDNDDHQIGRILTRREVLLLFGTAGVGLVTGCRTDQSSRATASPGLKAAAETAVALGSDSETSTAAAGEVGTDAAANTAIAAPACVVRPELTEGPYYWDENLVRSDIREDRKGVPLVLTFHVSQIGDAGCVALEGAEVEIWHCDAEGAYSGVSGMGSSTEGQKWLRGSQITGSDGAATFTTIYPGWYPGRAVHIHFKVRPDASSVFTSQLFFNEEVTDEAFAQESYASRGPRDTLNSTDNMYEDLLLVKATQANEGYAATFPIGIDLSTLGSGGS